MKAPKGVNLKAIGVMGKGVTTLGVGIAVYGAFKGETQEERALAGQDLAFTAFGEAFPAAAPFVSIPYAVGRASRDFREAREAAGPSILDEAAECH